ncbi:RBR-type E3 ubiquitin transferase [Entamoeba marina]
MNKKEQERVIKEILNEYREQNPYADTEKEVECELCYGELKVKELSIVAKCNHRFCLECIKEHFGGSIKNYDAYAEGYRCPQFGCETIFSLGELLYLKYITKEQFNETIYFVSKQTIDSDEYAIQCKNTKCLQMYIEKKKGCNPTKCPMCKQVFCIKCSRVWHNNMTCEEKDEEEKRQKINREQDLRDQQAVAQFTRPCPHCGSRIFKDGGCQWMQCKRCSGFFCWRCMQRSNNHAHKPGTTCFVWTG